MGNKDRISKRKKLKARLVNLRKQYNDNYCKLLESANTSIHKKYVKIERKLNKEINKILTNLYGNLDKCPIAMTTFCSRCTGYYKKSKYASPVEIKKYRCDYVRYKYIMCEKEDTHAKRCILYENKQSEYDYLFTKKKVKNRIIRRILSLAFMFNKKYQREDD